MTTLIIHMYIFNHVTTGEDLFRKGIFHTSVFYFGMFAVWHKIRCVHLIYSQKVGLIVAMNLSLLADTL